MLFSSKATEGDIFEVVAFQFNEGVSIQEQKEAMELLNTVVSSYPGFRSRDFYLSRDKKRWIDFMVWNTLNEAKKASDNIMQDEIAGRAFSLIDQKTVIFSHYDRLGGVITS